MATQVVFNIDPAVTKEAMKRAKSEGVPFASVLKMATRAYAEGKFTVGLHVEEKFNAKTAKEIRVALRGIERGRNLSPTFSSGKEMDEYLGI